MVTWAVKARPKHRLQAPDLGFCGAGGARTRDLGIRNWPSQASPSCTRFFLRDNVFEFSLAQSEKGQFRSILTHCRRINGNSLGAGRIDVAKFSRIRSRRGHARTRVRPTGLPSRGLANVRAATRE